MARLQSMYHVSTISPEDKPDGFVTHLVYRSPVPGINRSGSLAWPLPAPGMRLSLMPWRYVVAILPGRPGPFQHMIEDLPMGALGQRLSTENSYQYGIHLHPPGLPLLEVLPNLLSFPRRQMAKRGIPSSLPL